MKKTVMKVFAFLIALCVLFGAFPLSASAAASYRAEITYNSQYGYARMQSSEIESRTYGYIYAIPNDACLIDRVTVVNNTTGASISASYYTTLRFNDGTVSTMYRFLMPESNVSVDVKFSPKKEEKQITFVSNDGDLGFVRSGGSDIAIPTSTVFVYVCPSWNEDAGRYNRITGVTCTTESGHDVGVKFYTTTGDMTVYSFTMPDENVTVSAAFAPPTGWRRVQKTKAENGTLTVSADFSEVGKAVTVTAEADTGYALKALYYVDNATGSKVNLDIVDGKTEYSLSMPDADITVHAYFGLSSNAHTITTSCDGRLGGQINLNTYVAAPGETVVATVVPYNHHYVKDVVCINKSTGETLNIPFAEDDTRRTATFAMPDCDVEIIASYIFPSITVGSPIVYAGEGKTRFDVTYDGDSRTYTIEVYDDTEQLELYVSRDFNTITVTCAANGYAEVATSNFSRVVPLTEGVTEMTIRCEADDPNTGEHLMETYTLLIRRVLRYVPVERVILEGGAEEKILTYSTSDWATGWLPSVAYQPENADNKSVARWASSDSSILRYGYSNVAGGGHMLIEGKKFYTGERSGIVYVTATTPDGTSATLKVIVTNSMFHAWLTYDPGEGTGETRIIPGLFVGVFPDTAVGTRKSCDTDAVKLDACTFTPPAGKVFKAWSYRGAEYAPGDWIFLQDSEETVTAVYENLYTAVWLNDDGSELERKNYTASQSVPTTLLTPVKAADYYHTYTFDKWDDGTAEGNTITFRPLFHSHEIEQSTYLIHVNNLIGMPVTVEVESTDTVALLKQKLLAADGTAVEDQHLIYRDTLLRDDMTLADYDIGKEAVLDMAHQAAIRTIVWLDADGEELAREIYYKDEAEPAAPAIPEKAADRTHTYTFDRWDEGTVDGHSKTYAPLWKAHERPCYYIYVGYGHADVETAYPGDVVTLTADPADSNMYHAGWQDLDRILEIGDDGTFIMPDRHVYIYATYALKKTPELSIDFSEDTCYIGKPLTISGEISDNGALLDCGGEIKIILSPGVPYAPGEVTYSAPVEHGRYSLEIPALTTTNHFVWLEYPGEGIYGQAIVSTTIKVYEISVASLDVALYENDVKVEYEVGEALNIDNLYIWIFWMDGTVEEYPVTADMVSGFDSSAPGEITLTVACPYPYEEELTYPITVKKKAVDPGEELLLGDADGDGEVTILDATAIQRTLVSLDVPFFSEQAADTDGDGEVTILDATFIQRWLAGLPSNEKIGQPIA